MIEWPRSRRRARTLAVHPNIGLIQPWTTVSTSIHGLTDPHAKRPFMAEQNNAGGLPTGEAMSAPLVDQCQPT